MIKKSRKRFLKLFFENICPAILKPPLRIDLSIIPAEGVEREEKMRQFIHCNGPGEQIDGVSGGPEDGAVQSLEDSGGLLAAGEELLHLSTPEHEQFYRRCRA